MELQTRFDGQLLEGLIHWARGFSWGSFCLEHLHRLASSIPGAHLQGVDRKTAIEILDDFCRQGLYENSGKFRYVDRDLNLYKDHIMCLGLQKG
jgi:hypothetical protein